METRTSGKLMIQSTSDFKSICDTHYLFVLIIRFEVNRGSSLNI